MSKKIVWRLKCESNRDSKDKITTLTLSKGVKMSVYDSKGMEFHFVELWG